MLKERMGHLWIDLGEKLCGKEVRVQAAIGVGRLITGE